MGEVASQSLLQSLIDVVNDIASAGTYRRIHKKEFANLARRAKLLAPLFEEVKDFKGPLPEDAEGCFNALEKALYSAKKLLRLCYDGSKLFLVMETEDIARRFQEVTAELAQALDGLPYDLLDVSDEVREQVELVHAQLKRAKGRIDEQDEQLFADIKCVLSLKRCGEDEHAMLERLADKLELKTKSAVKQELRALEHMRKGEEMDEKLAGMLHILKQLTDVAELDMPQLNFGVRDGVGTHRSSDKVRSATAERFLLADTAEKVRSATERLSLADIPDDFRCPISLELMRDPVILASGQTYERAFIQKWLNEGKLSCPVTRVPLAHYQLTPNYVLRSVISQWCETHGIELPKRPCSCRPGKHGSHCQEAASKDLAAVEELLHKLTSGQADEQRVAAGELRLLAKRSGANRICIAEAGAIPLLVNLLRTPDLRTQEHAVTALLNLSIHDTNKAAIVLAGAINPIVEVLMSGSMEARENAAATLFSLSVVDENKVTIGASGAIPALVELLKEGTARGKKDAATALFNLSIYQGNKPMAISAGVVPPLMELVVDETSGMVDEALAVLAILATHIEGKVAIGRASAIPTLVDLIRLGSDKNKENAAAILLALSVCDPANATLACKLGAYVPLAELSQTGTHRAKRKSNQLLDHMKKLSMNVAFGLDSHL